jgi:hypothetical protein
MLAERSTPAAGIGTIKLSSKRGKSRFYMFAAHRKDNTRHVQEAVAERVAY